MITAVTVPFFWLQNGLDHEISVFGVKGFWLLIPGLAIVSYLLNRLKLGGPSLPFPVTFSGRAKVKGSARTAFSEGNLVEAVYKELIPSPESQPCKPLVEKRNFDPENPNVFTDNMQPEFFGERLIYSSQLVDEHRPRSFTIVSHPVGNKTRFRRKNVSTWTIDPYNSDAVLSLKVKFWHLPATRALVVYLTGAINQEVEYAAAMIDDRFDRSIYSQLLGRLDTMRRRSGGNATEPPTER